MAARAPGAGGGQARAPGTPTAPPALPPPWEGPSKPQLPALRVSERNKGTADIWHGTEKEDSNNCSWGAEPGGRMSPGAAVRPPPHRAGTQLGEGSGAWERPARGCELNQTICPQGSYASVVELQASSSLREFVNTGTYSLGPISSPAIL